MKLVFLLPSSTQKHDKERNQRQLQLQSLLCAISLLKVLILDQLQQKCLKKKTIYLRQHLGLWISYSSPSIAQPFTEKARQHHNEV